MTKTHTIHVSDKVYDNLKLMIDDAEVDNADNPESAHRRTFNEMIENLIDDQEELQSQKPSWQITDERVEALWHAIKVLKENDIMEEPEEHLWDEEVTVLQAMLTEADHDKP